MSVMSRCLLSVTSASKICTSIYALEPFRATRVRRDESMKIPSVASRRIKSSRAFEARHANTSDYVCLRVLAGTHDVRTVLGCAECQLTMPTGVPAGVRAGTNRHVNFSVMDRSKRRMRF